MIVHRINIDPYPRIVRIKVLQVLRRYGVPFQREAIGDDSVRDMFQEGWAAYIEAESHYDPSQGASLETYVGIRVEGAVKDFIRRLRCLPRKRSKRRRPEFQSCDLLDDVADDRISCGDEVALLHDEKVVSSALDRHIDQLPVLHAFVIRCCYYRDPPLTLREIGVMVGRTESRICQIRQTALKNLRRMIEDDQWFKYGDIN